MSEMRFCESDAAQCYKWVAFGEQPLCPVLTPRVFPLCFSLYGKKVRCSRQEKEVFQITGLVIRNFWRFDAGPYGLSEIITRALMPTK
jgi:hypothetical protein